MGTTNNVLQSSKSRVFLIEGRARPDHIPSYQSCLRMTGISRGYGDIERIECPDPASYGKFVEVAEIRGAAERATTSLEGRYALELISQLLNLANQGCAFDVQLHMGECTDPSNFNLFKKAVVMESAYVTSYSTEDMGALTSGDNAAVNETAEISAKEIYEILPMTFAEQAASVITNEGLDIVIADSISCGECTQSSDGCSKIFVLTAAAGGSPSTPADIVFTINRSTWYAHDVDSLLTAEAPNGLDQLAGYLVVVSQASGSLHYAALTEFNGYTDPTWTEVSTGFVAGRGPRQIWSTGQYAFIVGAGGYVYGADEPTGGVDVLDAGSATTDDLNAVHGLSAEFAVAVGNSGAVIYTENGTQWSAVARPVGNGVHLRTVWVKNKNEWWIGTSTGRLYYTLNKGVTWTEQTFPGSGTGRVDSLVFAKDSIAFLAHATTVPRGRILRSYDGGRSWTVMPESGSMPASDRVNALAVCNDANMVAGAGLADNGSDGFIVLGQSS